MKGRILLLGSVMVALLAGCTGGPAVKDGGGDIVRQDYRILEGGTIPITLMDSVTDPLTAAKDEYIWTIGVLVRSTKTQAETADLSLTPFGPVDGSGKSYIRVNVVGLTPDAHGVYKVPLAGASPLKSGSVVIKVRLANPGPQSKPVIDANFKHPTELVQVKTDRAFFLQGSAMPPEPGWLPIVEGGIPN
ncbi:MAG: hypothetical protein ABL949_09730 [Fimbriimonadaceae bacterium]